MYTIKMTDTIEVKLDVKKMLYTSKLPGDLVVVEGQRGKIDVIFHKRIK